MKSKWPKYLFILVLIGIVIFAYFKIKGEEEIKKQQEYSSSSQNEEKIKEITIGIAQFDTINPIISNNKNVQSISRLIYEPLVNLTKDYKPEAALAKEWAKQDEKTYIIKIRDDVKWSNGSKFTSEDVRFTIDKIKTDENVTSIYAYNVQYVSGVDIVDDYTLNIHLSQEVPFFEYYLTFPILSKDYYEGEDFSNTNKNLNPVGTGKYKIVNAETSYITLEKNDNWWNSKNIGLSLEKININLYSSVGELYNSFKTGNIDLLATDNSNFNDYIGTIGYNLKEVRGREHIFLALNTTSNILSDLTVRKAIAESIDKTGITSNVYGNKYYTCNFPLEYGSWLYNSSKNSNINYNLEQAKQELVDNGWSYKNQSWQKYLNNKTQKISLNFVVKASDESKKAVAENIKTQLENQGIRINLIYASDTQYESYLQNKNYDIILCSNYLGISPDMTTFFGEGNLANYSNEEITQIMNEVKNTTDEKILKEKYEKLEQIYNTQIPYISLANSKYNVLYNSNLVGDVSPNLYNVFYNIEGWYK